MRNKHTKRAEAAGHKIWSTPDTYTHARTHINTCTPPKYTTRGDWRLEVKKKSKTTKPQKKKRENTRNEPKHQGNTTCKKTKGKLMLQKSKRARKKHNTEQEQQKRIMHYLSNRSIRAKEVIQHKTGGSKT